MKTFLKLGLLILPFFFAVATSYGQVAPGQRIRPGQNAEVPNRESRGNPQANVRISERQAVELARQRFAGTILRISLVGEGANLRYQIRMESEGKIFTVFVHAITGQVSGGG